MLNGGLYVGLYVIGAISSLGKTTFCLQIADNIAKEGNDVLLFSLEMAKNEFILKSISQLTLLEDLQKNKTTIHAKTTRGIATGMRDSSYAQKEESIIETAIVTYSKYAEHIFIHEGIGNIGVEQIRQLVEKHKRLLGKAPVNMASFKESGAVEYSSDVLLALQYDGMDWTEGENEKDRNKRIRELMNHVIMQGKQGKS